ncbi:hypothetical protein BTO18_10310 [Polaribacter porphyrae]|uniref:NarX-like N-terminal domain-containing protein n=1 Tax=Polaribacter porphyrae TaxID=1137780 RepID=A0A2S7WPL8_9FLAO|nr:hypothetical protein BTO18_10310 [Polaribacter porphyrae]
MLFAINKISLHKDIKRQNDNISIVNISGKQRMLSQKISKLALYFIDNKNKKAQNISKLKNAISKFSTAHNNLKNNYLNKYKDTYLNELFTSLEPHYSKIIKSSSSLTNIETDTIQVSILVDEIITASNLFLPIMDNIVGQYEIIGKKRGEIILQRELTFNIIMITLSIYAVFFMIFPITNAYYKSDGFSLF